RSHDGGGVKRTSRKRALTKRALMLSSLPLMLTVGETMAADIQVFKAKAPPVVQDEWSGFYLGANVGYPRGEARVTAADPEPVGFNKWFGTLTGSLQIGYNRLLSPHLLVGIEADISFPNYLSADDVAWFRTTPVTDMAEKIDYLGTLRGRVGYVAGHWLVYATAGFAW